MRPGRSRGQSLHSRPQLVAAPVRLSTATGRWAGRLVVSVRVVVGRPHRGCTTRLCATAHAGFALADTLDGHPPSAASPTSPASKARHSECCHRRGKAKPAHSDRGLQPVPPIGCQPVPHQPFGKVAANHHRAEDAQSPGGSMIRPSGEHSGGQPLRCEHRNGRTEGGSHRNGVAQDPIGIAAHQRDVVGPTVSNHHSQTSEPGRQLCGRDPGKDLTPTHGGKRSGRRPC